MTIRFNRTLLERLLELRAISPEQLDQLERAQKEQGLSLRAAVVRLGCMVARSRGGRSLRQAALAKVAAGITSLAEALAVTDRA
jgi:type II secretory ATPase GspE/PulE/Tfp pilus assembly ATPase PilB-like protein